jgi:helicase
MAFLGLFVGIDRYASSHVNWLSYARRDAIALHALFTDMLGNGAQLLTDAAATRSAIEAQFKQLARCSEEDVVVVAFSGHGTQTHELVTYDADWFHLAETCIPLDTLTEWFSRIPARRLICILDCCFSGGMGAKVLHVDVVSRDLASADVALQQLSGSGRLILTASLATEPAHESAKLRHGLLTYYLLEALQGAEEVRQAGKIAVYRLLEYVTQRVADGAGKIGKSQHPTLRGQMDGEITWPVFVPGAAYRAAFPDSARTPVTPDVQSLAAWGFPPSLLSTWAGTIPLLNQLQIDAINSFHLLDGDHLVVSAPTSSGKTMIGELAALKGALDRKRAFFLLPLKALVNDKHQQFTRLYGSFGLKVIRATGEVSDDIPVLMRGQYDICLMTYEKFAALVLGAPHILEQVGTVVVDEVQMIADESRGANLEFILTLLRVRRQRGAEPQIVALSAVIGETNGLERWLGARLLRRKERPVPLDEGILGGNGSFRFVDPDGNEQLIQSYIQPQWGTGKSRDWVIPLVQKLVGEGKQVIVFRKTRGETRHCAIYLAEALGLPPAQEVLDSLPTGDLSTASRDLRTALAGGIAFHNTNLDREERLMVEEQFRKPEATLRVIVATTTLAMGVNTPASSVVIVGLEHPGPVPQSYTVAEYKNIVGRAGRLGFSERGTSFVIAQTSHEEGYVWSHYVQGVPEDIRSRFLARETDPRSLIVRVFVAVRRASGQGLSADDVISFLEGSFGAFQEMQQTSTWRWDRTRLLAALSDLERHKLVQRGDSGDYQLTPLGYLAGEAGVQVESITRLVDALEAAEPLSITDPTLIAATQLTTELDEVYFPLNKRSTRQEPTVWMGELVGQGIAAPVLSALRRSFTDGHQPTLRAKKAVACLLWVTDRPLADIEGIVTRFGGGFDAAGAVRAVTTRSCDLLPTVARVAELLHPGLDLAERAARLVARLEAGVPSTAADLAILLGTRLTRGDYQRLAKCGLGSIAAVEAASDEALLTCLDDSRDKAQKVIELRGAVTNFRLRESEGGALVSPILPSYEP